MLVCGVMGAWRAVQVAAGMGCLPRGEGMTGQAATWTVDNRGLETGLLPRGGRGGYSSLTIGNIWISEHNSNSPIKYIYF